SRASIQYRLSLTLRLNELAGENRHELCTAFETELLSGLLPQLGVSFRGCASRACWRQACSAQLATVKRRLRATLARSRTGGRPRPTARRMAERHQAKTPAEQRPPVQGRRAMAGRPPAVMEQNRNRSRTVLRSRWHRRSSRSACQRIFWF